MLGQCIAGIKTGEQRADLEILSTELEMKISFDGLPVGMTTGPLCRQRTV